MSTSVSRLATANESLKGGWFRTAAFNLWMAVAALTVLDVIGLRYTGLRFVNGGGVCIAIASMAIVALYYGVSGRSSKIADMAHYAALWVAFSLTGALLTYLAATAAMPLRDFELQAFDTALGFDWIAWHRFLAAHPILDAALGGAYSSLILQIIASFLYFAHTGRSDRNSELWWLAFVSLLLTTFVFALLPAAGASTRYADSQMSFPVYLPHLMGLRDGTLSSIYVQDIQGIITFPSYHTVLAVLLVYAYRGQRSMFLVFAALNLVMLLSIPSYGSHYLADMLAGFAVAALSIALVRWFKEAPVFFVFRRGGQQLQ